MSTGSSVSYIHCSCGAVFHRDTATGESVMHAAFTGHAALSLSEVEVYVERRCTVCRRVRGDVAHGYMERTGGAPPLYAWVCRQCVAHALGARSSTS